ncbi:MAG: hypothetical protein LIP08_03260 [Bacteroides sp.]|nr:hypothetical protein [Bacteroides sp.]
MYALCCKITIGKITFTSVNEVQIRSSIYNPGATALIKVPITAVLKQAGEANTFVETASELHVGDPVEIQLGYDNQLEIEFRGYVKRFNYKKPLEIECEDEFYLTRSIDCVFSAEETQLETCVRQMLPDIQLGHCTSLKLKNFILQHETGAAFLNKLKKEYGLTVFFDVNRKLYIGKMYEIMGEERVKYRLDYNVIRSDDLKYKRAEDTKLYVEAICYYKNGEMQKGFIGQEGGEKKTLYYYDVEDAGELKALAQEEHARHVYDGYAGKLQAFLVPYALPGMVADVDDPVYPERAGQYYIESTEVTFGTRGARRNVEIGMKV